MKTIEYKEGQEAQRKFENAMTQLFKAPKTIVARKPKKKAKKGRS